MISLDQMREYVQAADNLAEARATHQQAQRDLQQAERRMELAERHISGEVAVKPQRGTPTPSGQKAEGISTAELLERTMKVNKKLRGDSTIAIAKACPGTISEITERTGIPKTSVSTLLNRLMKDGIVQKGESVPMPGYANRQATVYELAV